MPDDFADSFFNEAVQNVLETMRESHSDNANDRTEQLAFPMTAFFVTDTLASTCSRHQRATKFLWCYGCEPDFCARLLTVLTDYYQHREKLTVGEMLAENVNAERSRQTSDRRVEKVNGAWKFVHKVKSKRPIIWDAIAAGLNKELKRLKGHTVKGDTLRSSIFDNEIKRRRKILQKWDDNITAWGRMQTS